MLPCVTAPDLARLDWPAARSAGRTNDESSAPRGDSALSLEPAAWKRPCDGGPPAELQPNSDDPRGRRDRAAGPLAQVSPPL